MRVRSSFSLCCPAISWWPVQGVSLPSPSDSWKRLHMTPATLSLGTKGYRKWMNVFKICSLLSWCLIDSSFGGPILVWTKKFVIPKCIQCVCISGRHSLCDIHYLAAGKQQTFIGVFIFNLALRVIFILRLEVSFCLK